VWWNLCLLYGSSCAYCMVAPANTEDHFEPLIRKQTPTGYMHCAANMVPCCSRCNSSKGGRSLAVWRPDLAALPRFCEFTAFHTEHAQKFVYDMDKFLLIRNECMAYLTQIHERLVSGE
jgi:hypothetical protein